VILEPSTITSLFSIENFQLFVDFAIDFIPFSVLILNIDFVSSIILPFNPITWGLVDCVISVCNPINSCDVILSAVIIFLFSSP